MHLVPVPCQWINFILPSKFALYLVHVEAASTAASERVVCHALQALRNILVCLTSFSQVPKDPFSNPQGVSSSGSG